jgi:hypothetical protein
MKMAAVAWLRESMGMEMIAEPRRKPSLRTGGGMDLGMGMSMARHWRQQLRRE